jgi:hypothetical protein
MNYLAAWDQRRQLSQKITGASSRSMSSNRLLRERASGGNLSLYQVCDPKSQSFNSVEHQFLLLKNRHNSTLPHRVVISSKLHSGCKDSDTSGT